MAVGIGMHSLLLIITISGSRTSKAVIRKKVAPF
jgi:hypothetical protein